MKIFINKFLSILLLFNYVELKSQTILKTKAQNEGIELNITDCFISKYYPKAPRSIQWLPGTPDYVWMYTMNKEKGNHLYRVDAANLNGVSKERVYIHLDSFQNAAKELTSKNKDLQSLKFGALPIFNFTTQNTGWFKESAYLFNFEVLHNGGIRVQFDFNTEKEEQAFEIFVDKNNLEKSTGFVFKDNIWIKTKTQQVQITKDGGPGIVYGQSVHRNEFGIGKGLFWSLDGKSLAFYRMDEKRVTEYPLFSISERPAKQNSIKYPMAGDSSHTVTVGVWNKETQKVIYLKTSGTYDHYLTNVTWSPNGNSIFIAWVNREQNKMELREYNALSGELIKTYFSHSHDKYIEPENGPLFLGNSSDNFIWQGKQSGFNHLYLYKNNSLNQITSGDWEVTEIVGLDKSKQNIIVNSTKSGNSNTDNALIRTPLIVNIQSKKLSVLTNNNSYNSGIWNEDAGLLITSYSNLNLPKKIDCISVNPSNIKKSKFDSVSLYQSEIPILAISTGEIHLGKITNEGVDLYTRTFFPPNFDPNKKYPVVVYVYGGPHAQMITNTWLGGGNLWMHFMAQKGYIVFTLDNRGSAHRGSNFENATFRKLGNVEMSDQLAGLNYLKSLNYVDSTRIGIHGWSFGGFMTTSLMTRTPGKYKVGVAGGRVIDWKYYEIMYTERYMDKPEENPEGYKESSLLNYAHQLNGRLLMIHGADDDVVVWQHSLMFLDKCVKSMNTNLDYYVYPGHKHNVVGPDRAHLYKKISQYFFDFL
jgi:dipeptidyl-peptidase-4